MQFNVTKRRTSKAFPLGDNIEFGDPIKGVEFRDVDVWEWELSKADGEVICRGPYLFDTEKEARSQIASAKKSMRSTQRCKVVTVDG